MKNILQIIVKGVLIVSLTLGIFFGLTKIFYNREVDRNLRFRSLPENSMDVLVLGSSHAQFSFQPGFFKAETGLYSYVLGSACQPLEVSVEMLKEALKTQKPKLVMLEVYTAMPLKSICHAPSCYVIAAYQMTGAEKFKTLSYLAEEKAAVYENDFAIHHNDWKTVDDWQYFAPKNWAPEKEAIADNFGYVFQEPSEPLKNYWQTLKYEEVPPQQLEERDYRSLEELYALCKQNGSQLFLFKTPIDGVDKTNRAYLDAVWKWAEEKKIPYRDFIKEDEEIGFALQVHADSYHAYVSGASVLTHELALSVKENTYSFHHKENDELNELYDRSARRYGFYALSGETNPLHILTRVRYTPGVFLLNYTGSLRVREELAEEMKIFSLGQIDFSAPFHALIENGKIRKLLQEGDRFRAEGHDFALQNGEVRIDGEVYHSDKEFSVTYWGYDVQVFDYQVNLSEAVWNRNVYDYNTSIN